MSDATAAVYYNDLCTLFYMALIAAVWWWGYSCGKSV